MNADSVVCLRTQTCKPVFFFFFFALYSASGSPRHISGADGILVFPLRSVCASSRPWSADLPLLVSAPRKTITNRDLAACFFVSYLKTLSVPQTTRRRVVCRLMNNELQLVRKEVVVA